MAYLEAMDPKHLGPAGRTLLNVAAGPLTLTEDEAEALEQLLDLCDDEWGYLGPPQEGSERAMLAQAVDRRYPAGVRPSGGRERDPSAGTLDPTDGTP